MVSEFDDDTIVATSLREMAEEIGVNESEVNILGILRCNWSEVTAITGVAVTPVVGFVVALVPGVSCLFHPLLPCLVVFLLPGLWSLSRSVFH